MLDAVFRFPDLTHALVDGLVMFSLEREEFLLCLENLFVLDLFSLDFGFFDYLIPLSLKCGPADKYVGDKGDSSPRDESDY